jgi:alpha-D-ribose 1-methylphosphonate 5-triphosphate synthase subunit PhnL
MTLMLQADSLAKTFHLHLQGGLNIHVLHDVALSVYAGECVVLSGPSGAGKSTLLRCLYGNYRASSGAIRVRHDGELIDLTQAPPRQVIDIRARTLGYVSQFLRVVPRVPALDIVAEVLVARGKPQPEARAAAGALLSRLGIPARLHALPPATFSGGEQQRVNLARGFLGGQPILLLDEPTASLDPANRAIVIELIREARDSGTAIIGIFHDAATRDAVADRLLPVHRLQDAA